MCNHRVLNPGLPAAQFNSFDSDEDADDPIEDEHHVTFACSGYVYARQLFLDLFSETTSTVGHFLSQPNANRVAKFLTWVRSMRLNRAKSDGSASGRKFEQTLYQINQSINMRPVRSCMELTELCEHEIITGFVCHH